MLEEQLSQQPTLITENLRNELSNEISEKYDFEIASLKNDILDMKEVFIILFLFINDMIVSLEINK